MTPFLLQEALLEEIEKITDDFIFLNPIGEEVKLKAYAQDLSMRIYSEDEDVDPFPHCIVQITEGESKEGTQVVNTIMVFGIYDDHEEKQGHKQVLNIIQRVQERFLKNPILRESFIANANIKWSLQTEEDVHPFYYGGVIIEFSMMGIRRESYFG